MTKITQQRAQQIFNAIKKWREAASGWRIGYSGEMIKVYQPKRSKPK